MKQKYFPTDDQIKAILETPLVSTCVLEKQTGLPQRYIRRLRNKNGIYTKNRNIDIDIDEFIKKYDELKSSDKVAEYFNVSDSYVVKLAKKIGYVNDSYKISKETEKLIINDYMLGDDNAVILKRYDISTTSLYRILHRNNIDTNKDKKQYTLDKNIFDTIDTPEKSYFIGFISADGSISDQSLKISISKKDEEILHMFKDILKTNKPIKYTTNIKNNKKYEYVSIEITNKHIVDSLKQIGIEVRKTWKNTIPIIDNKLFRHFLRGYFDGDGCITNVEYKHTDISISGFENNMIKIMNSLKDENILSVFVEDCRKYNINDATGRFGQLTFTNNTQKYCFLKWIYSDDNGFHLSRKYDKAMQFIDDVENSNELRDKQIIIYYQYAVLRNNTNFNK